MAVSKAEPPHSIISFLGVWKILSEFFKAHWKHWAKSHRDLIPLLILQCLIHTILQPLSQQGEVYGTAEELSFLLQSRLLLFRSCPSFLFVGTVAACEGINLRDHTAPGSDFHPGRMAWCADAEIWNRNAGNLFEGVEKTYAKETLGWHSDGVWDVGCEDVHKWDCLYYLSLTLCIAAGGTVPLPCLYQALGV